MRILLADDATLLREGLAGLLTAAGHEVVAQAADADALRREVARLAGSGRLPDVVVTDVRMPPTGTDDGLRAAVDLRRRYPGLPVVVLSAYVTGQYVQDLLEGAGDAPGGGHGGGAVGYLLKERVGRVADFVHSLDVVVGGGVVIDPEVVSHLMRAARAAGQRDGAGMAGPPVAEAAGARGDGLAAGRIGEAPGLRGARGPRADEGSCLAPVAPGRATASGPGGTDRGGTGLNRLTPREQEVLELMAQGLSNTQIRERLVLSDGAVAKHVASIFRALDLQPGEENRRVRAVLAWLHATA
ncbi:response regulator transcription factor [Actinomyces capricornis]|uniref:DNA-binding response regulator n=1 Tax=Actinomyces capricornis TaxID=2755559 RepID=A0ABN6K5D5_9ACTO|nr:response regulator transcription factor [Actinomyces capricornis]BDA64402.1 hypothetical protein MANAM107_12360 [Actinomyces capricornis]